jgi:hypothetical protein
MNKQEELEDEFSDMLALTETHLGVSERERLWEWINNNFIK